MKRISTDAAFGVVLLAILLLGAWALVGSRVAAEAPRTLPAPVTDEPPGEAPSEVVVLAGGCFWGVQRSQLRCDFVSLRIRGGRRRPPRTRE
jgi:peptide-methionine (S)-S-oxide reductase